MNDFPAAQELPSEICASLKQLFIGKILINTILIKLINDFLVTEHRTYKLLKCCTRLDNQERFYFSEAVNWPQALLHLLQEFGQDHDQ